MSSRVSRRQSANDDEEDEDDEYRVEDSQVVPFALETKECDLQQICLNRLQEWKSLTLEVQLFRPNSRQPAGSLLLHILPESKSSQVLEMRLRLSDLKEGQVLWDPLETTDSMCDRVFETHYWPHVDVATRDFINNLLRLPGTQREMIELSSSTMFRRLNTPQRALSMEYKCIQAPLVNVVRTVVQFFGDSLMVSSYAGGQLQPIRNV